MIVEMRIFNTYPGKTEEFIKLYETKGFPLQVPIQGQLLGVYRTEFGPILDVVMLWGYSSEEDRRNRRAKLAENVEWLAFRKEAAPLVRDEESRLLIPTESAWVRLGRTLE